MHGRVFATVVLFAALADSFISPGECSAGQRWVPARWNISAHLGASYVDDNFARGTRTALGLGLFARISGPFQVGALLGRDGLHGRDSHEDVAVLFADVTARWVVRLRSVELYPLLGTGIYQVHQSVENTLAPSSTNKTWGGVAGAGFRFSSATGTSPFSFGIEGRWHSLGDMGVFDYERVVLTRGERSFWEAVAALSLGFGD